MVSAFPSPVLAVAADAVRDLDGGDALTGLWTLFTKCKESLQDGRRLENISWRLWYRELASHSTSPKLACAETEVFFPRHTAPLTPTSENGDGRYHESSVSPYSVIPATARPTQTDVPGQLLISSTASSTGRPLTHRTKSSSSVGKIICDMIPDKLIVSSAKPPTPPALDYTEMYDSAVQASDVMAVIVAPLPSMVLPPSTPPSSSGLFPRVVVVNPTPHPTPPATPSPLVPPSLATSAGHHLLPPPRVSVGAARPLPDSSATPVAPTMPAPLSRVTAPPVSASAAPKQTDDATKPQMGRFFLTQEQSPSPERDRDSQDRGSQGSISTGKSPSDAGEAQPSSVASNHTKASTSSKRASGTSRGRKAKENGQKQVPTRPTMNRFQSQRHPLVQRKAAGAEPHKGRATFNVGSTHSNGSKAPAAGPSRADPPAVEPLTADKGASLLKDSQPPAQPPRRGIVAAHSSSEYETTDTEDEDSWSEEESVVEETRKPTKEEMRIREAALEAQRQRELFVKQPKRSYSNLNRTQSGLLSALLNPDPSVLPAGHRYRNTSSPDVARVQQRTASSSTVMPSHISTSKSTAALPAMAQVTAQAPTTNGDGAHGGGGGGYRPKGRPQGQEMEDDSDSEEENPDDTIQVSRSLAHQKLAALADPNRRRNSDHVQGNQPQVRPVLPTVATAPIPLNHPWNLPAPAPPTTPRTTRRQMLATELSESLRRNLLWERQVSKTSMMGSAQARRGSGLLGNGLRPLTTVQQAEATQATRPPAGVGASGMERGGSERGGSERGGQRGGDSRSGNEEEDKDDRKRRAMARNRSWADDYHYSGW